jgi:predicted phosphate transport protein (TIGR00153 family)
MRLLPREETFYEHFRSQASLIVQAAQLLLEAAKTGGTRVESAALQIKQLEEQADALIHEIFQRLNLTFLTPLDPEDIHSLASHLDDVMDGIEDAVHCMVDYHIDPPPPAAVEVCEHIVACARTLEQAIEALIRDRKLTDHCIEINRLEEVVDGLVRHAVRDLFERETDAIKIMKLKEFYEFLETTADRCEDVADVLENVIVKNA